MAAFWLAITPDPVFAARDSCAKPDLLVRITTLTDRILTAKDDVPLYNYDSLCAMIDEASQSKMQTLLTLTGRQGEIERVTEYLTTLDTFLLVRRVNGAAFGRSVLNTRDFKQLHHRMMTLKDLLCEESTSDRFNNLATKMKKSIGLGASNKSGATQSDRLSRIDAIRDGPSTLNKDTRNLMLVFFLLSMTIVTIYLLNLALDFFRAIRLSRYECSILTKIEIRDVEIAGTINVIGKQGLSFQVAPSTPEHHAALLTEGAQVRFLTDKYNFKALLTKNFTDGAGFRILAKLQKSHITELLTLSEIQPRRKIKFGSIKKTAKLGKVALALKEKRPATE